MKSKLETTVFEYLQNHYNLSNYNREKAAECYTLYCRFVLSRLALKTPAKFYKFRACNKQNFQTLEKNSIWMSKADRFIDVSDCAMSLNINYKDIETKHSKSTQGYLFCIGVLIKLIHNKDIKNPVITENDVTELKNKIINTSININIDNHRSVLSGWLPKNIEPNYFYLMESIYDIYTKRIEKLPSNIPRMLPDSRECTYVYSMTSIMDNNLLWENYANKYSGFCIEYTIPKEKYFSNDIVANILPVIYKRKIPSVEVNTLNLDKPTDEITKDDVSAYAVPTMMQMLYKHASYQYEHEWRLIGFNLDSSSQPFPYVSRIIAGKDIKPRNLSCLKNIAKKLNVSVSQQVFDRSKNKLTYNQIL